MLVILASIFSLSHLEAAGGGSSGGELGVSAGVKRIFPPSQFVEVSAACSNQGGCRSVAAAASQPHELARIRRELDCSTREADKDRQRVLNEATFLMQVCVPCTYTP